MRPSQDFMGVILVLTMAIMLSHGIPLGQDAAPPAWAHLNASSSEEAQCGVENRVVYPSFVQAAGRGYIRKAICPTTEPAPFLGLEVETELWLVTGYAVGDRYTPGWQTADGWEKGLRREVRPGITVACPKELQLGQVVCIEDIGCRTCEDRGSAIVGKRLDVAFESPYAALVWGKRWARVAVIQP